jgi:hypothetical protein
MEKGKNRNKKLLNRNWRNLLRENFGRRNFLINIASLLLGSPKDEWFELIKLGLFRFQLNDPLSSPLDSLILWGEPEEIADVG